MKLGYFTSERNAAQKILDFALFHGLSLEPVEIPTRHEVQDAPEPAPLAPEPAPPAAEQEISAR